MKILVTDENGCYSTCEKYNSYNGKAVRPRTYVKNLVTKQLKPLLFTHIVLFAKTGVTAHNHQLTTHGGVPVSELDASHYCHNPFCILLAHIGFEPNSVNQKRRKCFNRG